MKKIFSVGAVLLAAILTISCSQSKDLPRDNWDQTVYDGLSAMIAEVGNTSSSYDKSCPPYAVFDFDNTTVINDIEFTTMNYAIENLRFITEPAEMYGLLMDALQDRELVMKMKDGSLVPASDMAEDIASDYAFLHENYIADKGPMSLEDIHGTDQYKDFSTKFRLMYDGVAASVDAVAACRWILHLVKGATKDQLQGLVREAYESAMKEGGAKKITWESPDMGLTGRRTVTFDKGMAKTAEMEHLYSTLETNGIVVYICSASLEDIVEALAVGDRYGFNIPEERIYGMRQYMTEDGRYTGILLDDYTPTVEEGKTVDIREFIAPHHGGKGPALVAGDSNGDYSMLSSFDDMKVGLIINRNMKEPLRSLYGKEKYLLQGRDAANGRFIRSSQSEY